MAAIARFESGQRWQKTAIHEKYMAVVFGG
jgi:hypothetical protein